MLCCSCNEDIFDDDALSCTICNEYYHYMCVALKESTFRKMSKATKSKWACSKCKFNDKTQPSNNVTQQINPALSITNDDFNNLTESVKFMSAKFDSFGTQLQELLSSVKQMREENRLLKEQNIKNYNEILLLLNRVNTLEQKALDNYIEIVGVPEIKDENSIDTAKKIVSKLGVETTVKNAFRVPSKVINKPRKLVAELSTRQCSSNAIINSRKEKPRGNMFHEKWGMEAIYVPK